VPVEHIVLFRMKEGATEEQGQAMCRALNTLKEDIPGVLEVLAGKNETPRTGGGYEYVLVVRLRDRAALAAYGPHPAHQRIIREVIEPISSERIAIDYDVEA
jgi:hypothetical protein